MPTRRFRALLFIVGCLALLVKPALASVDHTQVFTARKAVAAPSGAFVTPDPSLEKALTATGFYNTTTQRPADLPTTAYFLYDDTNIYVQFHCAQAGTAITAVQTSDDVNVGNDDNVEFWLDPTGDGSRVYSFQATPKGIHNESSSENARYAPHWKSVAHRSPNGDWDVLMTIPLADIHAQSAATQRWRINFLRYIAGTGDVYTWAYEPAQKNVFTSTYWPVVDGVQIATRAARPKPRADVYSLGSAGSDHNQFENALGNFETIKARPVGIDAVYPFTNTLSLVGTLNPDFSNVESDQAVISPQEFQRNLIEYRPFFQQGAQFLDTLPTFNINAQQTLFYTPSIGVFNSGLKLEGTAGQNSVGVLNVAGNGFSDNATGYRYTSPNNALSAGYEGVYADHAGLHDDTSAFGGAVTNTHSGYVAAFNTQLETGSLVTNPSLAQYTVFGTGIQNTHFQVIGDFKDVGPAFDPIDSLTQINDIRGPQLLVQYTGGATGDIKTYAIGTVEDRFLDRSGAVHQADGAAFASATFKNLLTLSASQTTSQLRSYVDAYPTYVGGVTTPFNSTGFSAGYRDGTPSPVDVSYSWGSFGGSYLQQFFSSTTRHFGDGLYGVSLEYDGDFEHPLPGMTGTLNSQFLRRASLTRSFGKNATFALGLRTISGTGGFALPGTNIAATYHQLFPNFDELWIDFGSAAANQTLHRLIIKYVFHAGGGTGT